MLALRENASFLGMGSTSRRLGFSHSDEWGFPMLIPGVVRVEFGPFSIPPLMLIKARFPHNASSGPPSGRSKFRRSVSECVLAKEAFQDFSHGISSLRIRRVEGTRCVRSVFSHFPPLIQQGVSSVRMGAGSSKYGGLETDPGNEESLPETTKLVESPDGRAPVTVPNGAKLSLYTSHALSTWGERAWEFSVGLVILQLTKDSLRLVSLYGLASAVGLVFLSAPVGKFIDRSQRFTVVAVFYLVQNLSLVLAAGSTLFLLRMSRHGPIYDSALGIVMICSMVFWGVLSAVGQMGSTVSVEKEWVKKLCGDDEDTLAKVNSTMRTIDLTCLVLAPILSGFLMSYLGAEVAIIEIGIFNLLAWAPEVMLAKLAQKYAPQLQEKKMYERIGQESGDLIGEDTDVKKRQLPFTVIFTSLKLYYTQSCSPAMFALSLLYLTVLSLGILMTSYLKWLGLTEAVLSIYRGAGAFSGVLGARLFPMLQRKVGLNKSGMLGVSIQFFSLLFGVLPGVIVKLTGQEKAAIPMHFLVCGLVVSRFGLWLFDLSVSQIMQTSVEPEILGSVGAAQKLHENLFTVVLYIVGICVPNPKDFLLLMVASLGVVGSALFIYFVYTLKERQTVGDS